MCMTVVLPDRDLNTPADLIAQGWEVRREDYYDPDNIADDEDDACLCGFDVYAVLDRNGITYDEEIPGFVYVAGTAA